MSFKWFSTTVIAALTIFGTTSCKTANSGSGNTSRSDTRLLSFAEELGGDIKGVWSLECQSGYASPGYYQHTYNFSDNGDLSYENNVYSDSGCSNLISSSTCSGNFSSDETAGTVDIFCQEIGIELKNQSLVDAYNQKNICGQSWTINQNVNLTASSCTQNEASEQFSKVFRNYQIYFVQGSNLYFGFPDAIYTGASSDKRPVRLMYGMPYSR